MTLEQLEQAKKYEEAMLKAERIKKAISNVVYNVEKADGIDCRFSIETPKSDIGGICFLNEEMLLESAKTPNSTDIDLMRHFMGAAEKATEYFKKKIEEI